MFDNPYKKTGPAETAQAAEQLTKLPTLEETESELKAGIEELGAYASSLVPGLIWQWVDDPMTAAECDPPLDQTQGKLVYLRKYVSHPAIPDSVWPQVAERARQLAASLGATESETFANEPGNHTVRFYSRESTALTIGTRGAVISAATGCRLPAAIKNPAAPSAPASSRAPR